MAESLPLAAVAGPLRSLVRRAARQRGRVTITDHDEPVAVVIWVLHDEVKRRLGLDR